MFEKDAEETTASISSGHDGAPPTPLPPPSCRRPVVIPSQGLVYVLQLKCAAISRAATVQS